MKLIKNERGSTYIITALTMTVILGFAALVIDVGLAYVERIKLSNAVDAAALAGSQELPLNSQKAIQVAYEYAQQNGVATGDIEVMVEQNNTLLKVYGTKKVSYIFSKALGISESLIDASSTALVGAVTVVYDGIRPIAVEQQEFQHGQQVILKEDAGDGLQGNYGAIALGGTGDINFMDNIRFGYNEKLEVGDIIDTEPGNMAGPILDGVKFITDGDYYTFENYSKDSQRLWTIPVVETLDLDGRQSVKVVGFAEFFIEGAIGKAGKAELVGRFIKFTTNGDIGEDQINYGLNGVKLIQ